VLFNFSARSRISSSDAVAGKRAAQTVGDRTQQLGPGLETHRLVDETEAIDIQQRHDRITLGLLGLRDQVLEFLGQQQLVGQARRNVEIGDFLQRRGTLCDTSLEVLVGHPQGHVGVPLGAQRRGQLSTLGPVKRLFEQEDLVGGRDLPAQYVRIDAERTRHHDDVDVGIELANALRCSDAVHTGRHVHIDEGNGIRLATLQRCGDGLDRTLTLVAGMDLEAGGRLLLGLLAEKHLFEITKRRCHGIRLEILAEAAQEIANDARIVIDDEHPIDGPCRLTI
jgi:hypothetical protein